MRTRHWDSLPSLPPGQHKGSGLKAPLALASPYSQPGPCFLGFWAGCAPCSHRGNVQSLLASATCPHTISSSALATHHTPSPCTLTYSASEGMQQFALLLLSPFMPCYIRECLKSHRNIAESEVKPLPLLQRAICLQWPPETQACVNGVKYGR